MRRSLSCLHGHRDIQHDDVTMSSPQNDSETCFFKCNAPRLMVLIFYGFLSVSHFSFETTLCWIPGATGACLYRVIRVKGWSSLVLWPRTNRCLDLQDTELKWVIYIYMIVWGNGIFISKILDSKIVATLCHVDGILVVAVSAGCQALVLCCAAKDPTDGRWTVQRVGAPSSGNKTPGMSPGWLGCKITGRTVDNTVHNGQ